MNVALQNVNAMSKQGTQPPLLSVGVVTRALIIALIGIMLHLHQIRRTRRISPRQPGLSQSPGPGPSAKGIYQETRMIWRHIFFNFPPWTPSKNSGFRWQICRSVFLETILHKLRPWRRLRPSRAWSPNHGSSHKVCLQECRRHCQPREAPLPA